MTILIVLFVCLGTCIYLFYRLQYEEIKVPLIWMGFIFGGLLVVALLLIPGEHINERKIIIAFKSVRQTIVEARKAGHPIERVALIQDLLGKNEWLANKQYWNGTVFDIWIPDEVMELEPLK